MVRVRGRENAVQKDSLLSFFTPIGNHCSYLLQFILTCSKLYLLK